MRRPTILVLLSLLALGCADGSPGEPTSPDAIGAAGAPAPPDVHPSPVDAGTSSGGASGAAPAGAPGSAGGAAGEGGAAGASSAAGTTGAAGAPPPAKFPDGISCSSPTDCANANCNPLYAVTSDGRAVPTGGKACHGAATVLVAAGGVCGTPSAPTTHPFDGPCYGTTAPACTRGGPTPEDSCAFGPCSPVVVDSGANQWRCPLPAGGVCGPPYDFPCGTGLVCSTAGVCQ